MGILGFDRSDYAVSNLARMDPKDVRREYTRLRAIANKRIKRLGESEFKDTEAYLRNRYGFAKIENLPGQQILYNLNAVMRFLTAEAGSISGQKAIRSRTIETLHQHGYDFVNKTNFRQFAEFMEEVRAAAKDAMLSSEQVADFYEEQVKDKTQVSVNELQESFNKWLEHM